MKSYDDIIARVAIIINSGVSYRTLQMSSRESPYRASPCDRTITFNLTPPLHWSCSSRPLTLSLSLSLSAFSSSSLPLPFLFHLLPPILHHSVFLPTKSHSFFRFCFFNPWPVGCHSLGGSLIPVHSLNRSHKRDPAVPVASCRFFPLPAPCIDHRAIYSNIVINLDSFLFSINDP